MKIYFVLTVFFAVTYLSSAYVTQSGAPSTHKDFPNQCYVTEDKKGYSVGTHTPIGVCKRIICHENFAYGVHGDMIRDGTSLAQPAEPTCGTVGVPEGYHNERDLTKPYPDCCVNIVKDVP